MGKITRIPWVKNGSHEQWLQQRATVEGRGSLDVVRIGASDVSTVVSSNLWKSPTRLFYHLCNLHTSFFIDEKLLSGHLLEEITIKRWNSYVHGDEEQSLLNTMHNTPVRKSKKANYFALNSDYPHLFASLDYQTVGKQYSPFTGELYKSGTPIELKSTNKFYFDKWDNGITEAYLHQVQAQMALTNSDVCIFNVLVDGVNFHSMEVERDDEMIKWLDYETKVFADKVLMGKILLELAEESKDLAEKEGYLARFEELVPEPTMADDISLYEEIYEEGNELTKQATDEDDFNMAQYLKCNVVMNNIKTRKDVLRAKLVKSCEEFEGLESDTHKMVNRRAKDGKKAYFSIKVK